MPEKPPLDQLTTWLRQNSLLAAADELTGAELAQNAQWREYETGDTLFWEGETLPGLYIIQYGWLKVVKLSPSGREQILRFLEPGDMFNEIGVFTNIPNPATAVALEPVGVWLIQRETVQRLLDEQPGFARRVIAQMAQRMLYLVELVTDFSMRPVAGRLARLLLEEATDDVLFRPKWYTQAELAARLGTVPDVIQRALRNLENDGLIAVEKHQIRILNRATMETIAA